MKNILLKVILSIVVAVAFFVQQVLHAMDSPGLVTIPPLEWSFHPEYLDSMVSYYDSAVQTSTMFSCIYIVIIFILLWLPKSKGKNKST
jgi:hypothetical protein